jgi:dipeptidase E
LTKSSHPNIIKSLRFLKKVNEEKMTIILTSLLKSRIKDEEGNHIPIPIEDTNGILTNIKNSLKKTTRFVSVANNPISFEENDERARQLFESIELTFGKNKFQEKILLDGRNMNKAEEILKSADFIFLQGGKCLQQIKFFEAIHLKEIISNFDGVVVGSSAGAMNLCDTVANFPEELVDLDEPRWFEGLGFYDQIVIPHFDGETLTYQIPCDEIDPINDYILPMSQGKTFLGLTNESYIMIDNNKNITFFGDIYTISDGKVNKLQQEISR